MFYDYKAESLSFDSLEHIKARNGEFIVGLKMDTLKRNIQEDFYDLSKFTWINSELAICETNLNNDQCIITWSKSKVDRDRKAREDVLEKIETTLSSSKPLTKKIITNRAYKKYLSIQDKVQCTLNHKTIEKEAKRDGFFGIITNVKDIKAGEIVSNYKELWRIELTVVAAMEQLMQVMAVPV